MKYPQGIQNFLSVKKLSPKDTINKFLEYCKITTFNYGNILKSASYIQNNWNKFATFCDKGIKSGILIGNPVKLNYYYQEQKYRNSQVRFEMSQLTEEQLYLIKFIKSNSIDKLQSFVNTHGYSVPPKDYSKTSKTTQFLPLINLVLSIGIEKFKSNQA